MRYTFALLLLACHACHAAPGELITISGYAAVGGVVRSMAGVTLVVVNPTVPQPVYLCNPTVTRRGVTLMNPTAAGQRCRVLRPRSIWLDSLAPVDGVWTADGRVFANGEVLQ